MAKKIKKKIATNPNRVNNLLDFIKQDKKEEVHKDKIKSNESSKTFFNSKKPSQIGYFVRWKNKNIQEWNCYDFLGLYLNLYVEKVGEEDIEFMNRNRNYKFGKERGRIDRCRKNFFNENNDELKSYIEFMFDWWMSEESFVDGYPAFWAIFSEKSTFVKIFKESRSKFNKKKVSQKRKDIDNSFASKDIWDAYLEDDNNV